MTDALRFERVDPDDKAAFATWFSVMDAAQAHDFPGEPGWFEPELNALAHPSSDSESVVETAFDDHGEPVGALFAFVPTLESLHLFFAEFLMVRPDRRGRGVGRALVARAEDVAREFDRSTVVTRTEWPGTADEETRDSRFARKAGYSPALLGARRTIELPVGEDQLGMHEAASLPFATGYRILTWQGPTPAELRADRCALAESMSTDAPSGEVELGPEAWTEERLRSFESRAEAMQRTTYSSGAIHDATGQLVAFSDAAISRVDPLVGYQWDTIVLGAHRGHRLGTLVKVANLRQLMEATPATRRIHTMNARDNEPMIRVNEALGFTVTALSVQWQKRL